MHELILVMFLLMSDPKVDGSHLNVGPITEGGVTGQVEVMTWSSHDECYEYGTHLIEGDDKVSGFICVVKPARRYHKLTTQ